MKHVMFFLFFIFLPSDATRALASEIQTVHPRVLLVASEKTKTKLDLKHIGSKLGVDLANVQMVEDGELSRRSFSSRFLMAVAKTNAESHILVTRILKCWLQHLCDTHSTIANLENKFKNSFTSGVPGLAPSHLFLVDGLLKGDAHSLHSLFWTEHGTELAKSFRKFFDLKHATTLAQSLKEVRSNSFSRVRFATNTDSSCFIEANGQELDQLQRVRQGSRIFIARFCPYGTVETLETVIAPFQEDALLQLSTLKNVPTKQFPISEGFWKTTLRPKGISAVLTASESGKKDEFEVVFETSSTTFASTIRL